MAVLVFEFICAVLTLSTNIIIGLVVLCQSRIRGKGHGLLLVCMGVVNIIWAGIVVALVLVSFGYSAYLLNAGNLWILQIFASVLTQIFAFNLFCLNIDQCVYMLTTKRTPGYNTKLSGQVLVGISVLVPVLTWTPYLILAATSRPAPTPLLRDASANVFTTVPSNSWTGAVRFQREFRTGDGEKIGDRENIFRNKTLQNDSSTDRPWSTINTLEDASVSKNASGFSTFANTPVVSDATSSYVDFTTATSRFQTSPNFNIETTGSGLVIQQEDFRHNKSGEVPESFVNRNKICNITDDANIANGMYSSITFLTCNALIFLSLCLTLVLYVRADLYSETSKRIKAFMCIGLLYMFLTLPYWILVLVDSINLEYQLGCDKYAMVRIVHDLSTFLVPLFVAIMDPEIKDALRDFCCCQQCRDERERGKHQPWDEESHLMETVKK